MDNENILNMDLSKVAPAPGEELLAPEPIKEVGSPIIKVLGVGGGGSNAVTRMYRNRIPGIDYIVVNTDKQALDRSSVPDRLRIGDKISRGLGVGGSPPTGRACMEEDSERLRTMLDGADMVFVAAGMGGGTGTGAAPIVAKVAQDVGALTIGVVTKPFTFEGAKRQQQAIDGIEELKHSVDTLIVIPNDRLMELSDAEVKLENSFEMADNVLRQGVQAIAEIILVAGDINVDFADVRSVMDKAGPAWMAIGRGSGEGRALKAAQAAMNSPMLEVDIEGATGMIFNVTGGSDLKIKEVTDASEFIKARAHPEANIIFGSATDPTMEDEVKLTIVATGFESTSGDMPSVGGYSQTRDVMDQISDDELKSMNINIPPFLHGHPAVVQKFQAQARRKQREAAEAEKVAAEAAANAEGAESGAEGADAEGGADEAAPVGG